MLFLIASMEIRGEVNLIHAIPDVFLFAGLTLLVWHNGYVCAPLHPAGKKAHWKTPWSGAAPEITA